MDTFRTIKMSTKNIVTEKRSKFVAYAIPVKTAEEVKIALDKLRKEYYDARHICWAYMLGDERTDFRSNDDGEPSGTAGKPILGQINSNALTYILIAVVRYFGGIKLGTSGLIVAYKAAAAAVIDEAEIIVKTIDKEVSCIFEYPLLNEVMKIVKDIEPTIIAQNYDSDCSMKLRIRRSLFKQLVERLEKVETLQLKVENC